MNETPSQPRPRKPVFTVAARLSLAVPLVGVAAGWREPLSRILWAALCLVLLGVIVVGVFFAAFGFEAIESGANPVGWLGLVVVMVVAPTGALAFCAWRLFRSP
jgi:nucleoside recognition membrane protein YjiH